MLPFPADLQHWCQDASTATLLESWLSANNALRPSIMSATAPLAVVILSSKALCLCNASAHYPVDMFPDCLSEAGSPVCLLSNELSPHTRQVCAIRRNAIIISRQHGAYCRPHLNSPASIEAACDVLEEVIELRPHLVQVRLVCNPVYMPYLVKLSAAWVWSLVLKSIHADMCKP